MTRLNFLYLALVFVLLPSPAAMKGLEHSSHIQANLSEEMPHNIVNDPSSPKIHTVADPYTIYLPIFTLPPAPQISDFLLYAERSILLGSRDVAKGGDIGVRTVASNPASQLTVDIDARIDGSHSLIAPSVTLQPGAVVGMVQTNVLNASNAILTGSFPASVMPALPLGRVSSSGTSDVTVGKKQTRALPPGTYGTLDVQGVLQLRAGNYSFSQITLDDSAQLIGLTEGIRVDVAQSLVTGTGVSISPGDGRPASDLTITVAGHDDILGQRAATLGLQNNIRLVLAVPHGTLSLGAESHAKGAFAGFDIIVGGDVGLEYDSGIVASEPGQHGQQQLSGYFSVPANPGTTPIVSPVPAATPVQVAIGLPVRDRTGMEDLAAQVSDPKNPKYRQYLTVDQFVQTFGPSTADYQALVHWAQSTDLNIDSTYRNNLLVSIRGTAAEVEQALYANLVYRQRKDGSTFITVDRDPSLDLSVPILRISGLNDADPPHPLSRPIAPVHAREGNVGPDSGSGPKGKFGGNDFRVAYAPRVSLTGAGQSVALVQFNGFFPNDITQYENHFSLPNVPVITHTVDAFNGLPDTSDITKTNGEREVALDIEMVIAMAPGLAAVEVYEGFEPNKILNAIAAPPAGIPLSRQVSSSWGYHIDDNTKQILAEFAIQGQSYFQSSGDDGAFPSDPGDSRDLPYSTIVGGTALTMNGKGLSWQSETTWAHGGGGILTGVPVPDYQKTVDFSQNGGSTQFRNTPDVSMVADSVAIWADNGLQQAVAGTSIAAPLWAGYMALVNEQAQNGGKGPVGFANPTLYLIGQSAVAYPDDFHDINDGSSNPSTTRSPNNGKPLAEFKAVTGFDLATGWGTPTASLINDLSGNPRVTIRYHQVGACNGYAGPFGLVGAGPNAAFVIFGVESIDNSQSRTAFAFDPAQLYIQQAQQEFIDPSLHLARDILGPFAATPVTVNPGQNLKFSISAYGATTVTTTNPNGAVEANQTAYFLRYNTSPSSPRIVLEKTDSTRTSWPLTEDCKTIALH